MKRSPSESGLEAIDTGQGRRIRSIGDLYHPQGVALVPESSRPFVACEDETVSIFNSSSLTLVRRINLRTYVDNIQYKASSGVVYVGYGNGTLAAPKSANGNILGRVNLSGHPKAFEVSGRRTVTNVPPAGHIVVMDREKMAVIATWPAINASDNIPMALSEAGGRIFAGCRQPPRLLVYNTDSGTQIATLKIDGDIDDVFYDNISKRIYASCGIGSMDVLRKMDKDSYQALTRDETSEGARTSLLVPELSKLHVAAPQSGGRDARVIAYAIER